MLNKLSVHAKKGDRGGAVVAKNIIVTTSELIANLSEIQRPSQTQYPDKTRSNASTVKVTNNKSNMGEFTSQIFQYSGAYVKKGVDIFDKVRNTLTILNAVVDHGTALIDQTSFEIYVNGLQITGNYTINQIGADIVISLNDEYIHFAETPPDEIYVFGKIKI